MNPLASSQSIAFSFVGISINNILMSVLTWWGCRDHEGKFESSLICD